MSELSTLRSLLEGIRDRNEAYAPFVGAGDDFHDAVAALALLDAAPRIGEEDYEWSDTDRLVPDAVGRPETGNNT